MTLQQEIVYALRKAGKIDVALARMHGARNSAEFFAEEWNHLATRVENARRETCVEHKAVETTNDTSMLLKEIAAILQEIVNDAKGYESRNGKTVSWRERVDQVLQKCHNQHGG